MRILERLSFRQQLTIAAAATSALALLFMAGVLIPRELLASQRELEADLVSLADVIGANSTGALDFADARTAGENLAALRGKPSILAARLFLPDGRPLADYVSVDYVSPAGVARPLPARPEEAALRRDGRDMVLFRRVAMGGKAMGTLYLRSSRDMQRARLNNAMATMAFTFLGAMVLAAFLASRINDALSRPIVALTAAARDLSVRKDYSVRVPEVVTPVLATLTAAFNGMVEQIEQQDADLRSTRDALEDRVRERMLELRASQEQLRAVVEHSTNVFFSHTPDDVVTYVSPQCRLLLDCDVEEALAHPSTHWLTDNPVNRKAMAATKAAIRSGQRQPPCELEMRGAAGRLVWVEVNEAPVMFEGRCTMVVGALTDITERKRAEAAKSSLEDQLRQAQKMEAIGRLAGGVAHDFNNLLGVIMGYGEQLARTIDEPRQAGKIEQILQASERAATLTRQLLAFSRRQVIDPKVLELSVVVGEMEKMLRRLIGEDVRLSVDGAADLGTVRADPGQIEQVVMNLAVNARDAMPSGGELVIGLQNVELAAGGERRAGRYVMLSFRDTGCGMSESVRSHIFEPFFTTKEQGKGTGLGLATVYGIVQQSDGHIEVDSREGEGTTFRIYLPRVDAPLSPRRTTDRRAVQARGIGTVLVVEDDDVLRPLVGLMLEDGGYTVLSAASGAEALQRAEQHGGPIAALVTDVVMPNMNGREVADRLRARVPGLAVLYMTGYTDDFITRSVLERDSLIIQKPFSMGTLLEKIGLALSSAGAPAARA